MIGSQLSHFKITAKLGAGGMGEVYKAEDTRLDRTVAIKVLPADVAGQPELKERLEREAMAISSLNHPHICTLYDLGSHEGTDFLVMEYLEGESLAERLVRGALPLREAMELGIQIADALEIAHREGLIHRDLKPGNVMLTSMGAKLLDFGLAKDAGLGVPGGDLTASPTWSRPLTAEGSIVGTFQYMSPEQLQGEEADARSDVFGFGAMLYEALTGEKAFSGGSAASLIATILKEEPRSPMEVESSIPAALDRVVRQCLAKSPDDRWQSAGDLRRELEWIGGGNEDGDQGFHLPSETSRASLGLAWGLAAMAGLVALLLLVLQIRPQRPADPPRVLRASIAPPVSTGFGSNSYAFESHVAVSPDGNAIAFVAGNELWLRPLSSVAPARIAGTEGAVFPFWSPDSTAIGFFANGKLKTVEATGGPVATICDAPQARGGSWSAGGTILLAPDLRTGIFQVDASGGEPTAVTEIEEPVHSTHRWPEFLPDGKSFFFLAASHSNPRGGQSGIYLASVAGGEPRMITESDSKPVLSAGRLVFLREGNLLAQTFDFVDTKLVGEMDRLAQGVRYRGGSWIGVFSASRRDVLAYEIGSRNLGAQLTWFDRLGNVQGTLGDSGLNWDLRFSPQGDRLAVSVGSPEPEIWIHDLDRGVRTLLTLESSFNRSPVWSPDGERLVFAAMNESGRLNLYQVSSRGADQAKLLRASGLDQVPTSWSPDGEWLAFDQGPPGATQVWVMPLEEGGIPRPFVETPPWAGDGQFSPDGKWLLYTSRESGVDQVYVSPFPGPGGRWQLSGTGWGSNGRWSRDGNQVYFATARAILMEVDLRPRKGGGLDVGMPRMLFSYRYDDSLFRGHNGFYDVGAGEDRFILAQGPEREEDQGLIRLVLPWSAELEEEN